MASAESLGKIGEKIKGIRTCMLVTMDENGLHMGRPMSMQDMEFDGTVWFMTSKDSKKIQHIQKNPEVGVMFGDGSIKFVSLSGKASQVDDKEKIHEFWNDFYKAWFDGEDDPNITLIKVDVSRAEYWDYPGGKLGAYADMAKSAVTGQQSDGGENEVITL